MIISKIEKNCCGKINIERNKGRISAEENILPDVGKFVTYVDFTVDEFIHVTNVGWCIIIIERNEEVINLYSWEIMKKLEALYSLDGADYVSEAVRIKKSGILEKSKIMISLPISDVEKIIIISPRLFIRLNEIGISKDFIVSGSIMNFKNLIENLRFDAIIMEIKI